MKEKTKEQLDKEFKQLQQRNTELMKKNEERVQTELQLAEERAAVNTILSGMLRGESDEAAIEKLIVDTCLATTDSVYSMMGRINKQGNWDTTAYTSGTIEACAFPEALGRELSTGMPIRGIWGWPLIHGQAMICNDPASHPDRTGAPKGHVPVEHFLGVPLKDGEKVVGMIAVLNKPGGYTEADKETLVRLAAVVDISRQRREAEKEINAVNQKLNANNQQLVASEQQLKAANQHLEASNQQLHASEQDLALRIKLAEVFLTAEDDEMMFTNILELILPELQSKFGVFGYLDDNGDFVVPTMTRHIWDKCEIPDKRIVFPREKWGCSSWPRAINEGKANYSNEVSTITPKGHVAIERHISFPIMYQGNPIGLFQVANRDTDYGDADLVVLGRIADIVAPILAVKLQRDRQEKERKQAEEKIKATNQQLVASEQQLKAANQQLVASEQQLKAANQQLEANNQQLRAAEEELTKHRDHLQEMVDEQTAALKESEKYYRSIVQTALDGFWINDLKGGLVDVNDSYCKMIGYSREELLGGMSISDIEAVENPEETEKHIKHILDHGYDRFESRHRRKDGKIIDLEITATYSAESGGRLIVFLSDITERRVAEKELKEKMHELEIFHDAAVDRELKMKELRDRIEELENRFKGNG